MILVVGATGTVGGMIARGLLEQGRDVRIPVRPGSNYRPLVDAGAEPVVGDLKDPPSLVPACAGPKPGGTRPGRRDGGARSIGLGRCDRYPIATACTTQSGPLGRIGGGWRRCHTTWFHISA